MITIKSRAFAKEIYLEVGLREAARHGDHGGSERARDADGGQELGDVRRQAEGNGAVGIQVTRGVVDVKAEVGDIEFPGVLEETAAFRSLTDESVRRTVQVRVTFDIIKGIV